MVLLVLCSRSQRDQGVGKDSRNHCNDSAYVYRVLCIEE